MKPKILVLNGPNLNKLGQREPAIYGSESLDAILSDLQERFTQLEFDCLQSNHEGVLIDAIHTAHSSGDFSGLIINAGALSHYSYALRDALALLEIPKVEVHLSNIYAREPFRAHSVISAVCTGVVSGFGRESYFLAAAFLSGKIVGIG